MATEEKRSIRMHEGLIFKIIEAQAGTQGKAILELIMNSIDAGGSKCEIKLTQKKIDVRDNGKGFSDRSEIETSKHSALPIRMETLGTAMFRIGRGQIMAFAKTKWTSGTFEMDVDIKNRGTDYTLQSHPKTKFNGCHIQGAFYEPLSPSTFEATLRELKSLAAFAEIPVILNGEQINTLPSTQKWDFETEDAYIKLSSRGGMKVYNLGVLVREYPAYQFGTGGIIVSKRALEVNFARTDVLLQKCQIFKRVMAFVKSQIIEETKTRKARMTDSERAALIENARFDETVSWSDIDNLPLLRDITGRYNKVNRILQLNCPLTLGEQAGSLVADKIHQKKMAFVLHPETPEAWGVNSLEELLETLAQIYERNRGQARRYYSGTNNHVRQIKTIPYKEVSAQLKEGHSLILEKEWTQQERALITALRKCYDKLFCRLNREDWHDLSWRDTRRILIGVSDSANAWTDGSSYIAFNRKYIKLANKGFSGCLALATTMLHEMAHTEADGGSHIHDEVFYQHMMQIVEDDQSLVLGRATQVLLSSYVNELRKRDVRVNKNITHSEDVAFDLDQLSDAPEGEGDAPDREVIEKARLATFGCKLVPAAKAQKQTSGTERQVPFFFMAADATA